MDSTVNTYPLARDIAGNARLTLQHYLYKDSLGYLLHPRIPLIDPNMTIAEIGVGTCIWLIELARTLPETVQLHGFDISFQQCPPEDWIPENITLITQDMTQEPPQRFHEQYDVIHIRFFVVIVQNNDPVPILRNAMKMLTEPGGYIQWVDLDFTSLKILRSLSAPSQENDEIMQIYHSLTPDLIASRWVPDLPRVFDNNGLELVAVDRRPPRRETVTLIMDTALMGLQELFASEHRSIDTEIAEHIRELLEKAGDNRRNTAISLDVVASVGRKPVARLRS